MDFGSNFNDDMEMDVNRYTKGFQSSNKTSSVPTNTNRNYDTDNRGYRGNGTDNGTRNSADYRNDQYTYDSSLKNIAQPVRKSWEPQSTVSFADRLTQSSKAEPQSSNPSVSDQLRHITLQRNKSNEACEDHVNWLDNLRREIGQFPYSSAGPDYNGGSKGRVLFEKQDIGSSSADHNRYISSRNSESQTSLRNVASYGSGVSNTNTVYHA
jgi:hypothetical protein